MAWPSWGRDMLLLQHWWLFWLSHLCFLCMLGGACKTTIDYVTDLCWQDETAYRICNNPFFLLCVSTDMVVLKSWAVSSGGGFSVSSNVSSGGGFSVSLV